jgi:hypothetical protein
MIGSQRQQSISMRISVGVMVAVLLLSLKTNKKSYSASSFVIVGGVGQQQRRRHNDPSSTIRKYLHLDNIGFNDIDNVRLQLEAMIGPLIFTTATTAGTSLDGRPLQNQIQSTHRPLLTNIGRKKRELEIQLLRSLEYSDDGIDELMSLWMTECLDDSANTLLRMEQDCSTGQEENVLRKIIQDSNGEWTEPINRLAFLLFVKRRYDESLAYCRIVLQQKPWHFEAIQLQVLLSLVKMSSSIPQGHNNNNNNKNLSFPVLQWARKGLPPLQHRKRRKVWVDRAVSDAQKSLLDIEEEDNRIRQGHFHLHHVLPSTSASYFQ